MSELFTLDTLQEFWAKRPKGAKLQSFNGINWVNTAGCPNLGGWDNLWRWEPQSKPVDLSPLVGSGALCELSLSSEDEGTTYLGFLAFIYEHLFLDVDYEEYKVCRPVMNKWMAVDKSVVIPEGLESTVAYVGGWVSEEIKLVKFYGLKEGYHWPWEDK